MTQQRAKQAWKQVLLTRRRRWQHQSGSAAPGIPTPSGLITAAGTGRMRQQTLWQGLVLPLPLLLLLRVALLLLWLLLVLRLLLLLLHSGKQD